MSSFVFLCLKLGFAFCRPTAQHTRQTTNIRLIFSGMPECIFRDVEDLHGTTFVCIVNMISKRLIFRFQPQKIASVTLFEACELRCIIGCIIKR